MSQIGSTRHGITAARAFGALAGFFRMATAPVRTGRGAWAVSAMAHLALLVVLGLLVLPAPSSRGVVVIDSRLAEVDRPVDFVTILDSVEPATPFLDSRELLEPLPPGELDSPTLEALALPDPLSSGAGAVPEAAAALAGTGSEGEGGAGFFGVAARGRRFVYVVDASPSMEDGGRFNRAREELLRSISRLSEDQEFYIILFNDRTYPLFYPERVRELVPATQRMKDKAQRWVQGAVCSGGTYPEQALLMSLTLEPDAVYLLSDGRFSNKTVRLVRHRNKDGIVIHTIGFEDRSGETMLRTLAEENHGTYRFVP